MTTPDLNVSFAVMNEQLKSISEDAKEARVSRALLHQQIEKLNEISIKMDHRLEKVETFMSGAQPTLQEWNALRYKVQGAGTLGKALWWLAGVTIGAVAAFVGYVAKIWGH